MIHNWHYINVGVAVNAVPELEVEMEKQANLPVVAALGGSTWTAHSHTEKHFVPGQYLGFPAVWSFPVWLFFFGFFLRFF